MYMYICCKYLKRHYTVKDTIHNYQLMIPSAILSVPPASNTNFTGTSFCFMRIWKLDVRTICVNIVITSNRDCGSAEWITYCSTHMFILGYWNLCVGLNWVLRKYSTRLMISTLSHPSFDGRWNIEQLLHFTFYTQVKLHYIFFHD